MREIKFRGKRRDNGEWVYGYLYVQRKTSVQKIYTVPCIQVLEYDYYSISYEVIPETVGQYINKKDSAHKEMYEGDRVNHGDNYPSVIIFSDYMEGPCFCLKEIGNEDSIRYHSLEAYTNPIEVIGDIYG